jgi:uncharacterized membrane protein YeaQ/YmgE (transglycosylase-associated protein family)
MGILGWVILGLIVGSVAKAILPGDYPGGLVIATLIGMAGAILGGFLAQVLFNQDTVDDFFDISTWLAAIVGAVIVMVVYGRIARLTRRSRQVPPPRPPAGGVRPVHHEATGRAVSPGHHEEPPAMPVARAEEEVRDLVTPRAERPTPTTIGVFN